MRRRRTYGVLRIAVRHPQLFAKMVKLTPQSIADLVNA